MTDSVSTLQKVQTEYLYADCMDIILRGPFDQIIWIFRLGHAGVVCNERATVLAGAAVIENILTLDPPTVLQCIKDLLALRRKQTSAYTLPILKEKGVQVGKCANDNIRGTMYDRISFCLSPSALTLRWPLLMRN